MGGDRPIVYIVDDDSSIRRSLGRVIRAVDLDVETFSSAEGFLDHKRSGKRSCLVLDLRLGGMSGRELKRRLDGAGESPPTIFMSAHEEDLAAARAEEKDAVDCLEKPFPEDIFLRTIYSALGLAGNRPNGNRPPVAREE